MPTGCEGRVCRSSCGLRTVRAELVEALVCWFERHAGVEGGGRESPGVRVTFFCFAKRKSPKKRRPPVCDPFAVRRGKPAAGRLRGAPWNSLCCCAAPLGQPRRVSSRGMRAPTRMLTPQPPRRRRSQQGVDSRTSNSRTATRAFASLGPLSRAQAPRAAQAGPSAAMARVDVRFAGSLLDAPGARRARGGMRVGARMLRELTHRSCPSGAPQARSEFCGAPRDRAPQVAPQRSEGVADSRVALSLVTFFRRRCSDRTHGKQVCGDIGNTSPWQTLPRRNLCPGNRETS
mgnify:CR=1 FL=1